MSRAERAEQLGTEACQLLGYDGANHEDPPAGAGVKVGIDAAGHYHQPLMGPSSWPPDWEL